MPCATRQVYSRGFFRLRRKKAHAYPPSAGDFLSPYSLWNALYFLKLVPARVGLTEFVYPMGLMSAVTISWGIMLLIADRKPIERRWILMPTIIVVALLNGVRIYATANEMIEFSIVFLVAGFMILFLLIYSYIITRNIQSQK